MNMGTVKITAEHKVAGGKLLRCALAIDCENTIRGAKITGDFFMHPEEKVVELENALCGLRLEKRVLGSALNAFYKGSVSVIGASPDDFVVLLLKCAPEKKKGALGRFTRNRVAHIKAAHNRGARKKKSAGGL